jgi:hypothetical protein
MLFLLPVSWPSSTTGWVPKVGRCRAMSAVMYLSRAWSHYYVRVAVGIASPSHSIHKLFLLPVSCGRHFEFPMLANVGQCPQCHIQVGRGWKCWGSSWSRVAISFRSRVIAKSSFYMSIFGFRAAILVLLVNRRTRKWRLLVQCSSR